MKKILFVIFVSTIICCKPEIRPDTPRLSSFASDSFLDNWTYHVIPHSGRSYVEANFKLWIPENSDSLKAILVLIPGYNGDGTWLAHKELWQEFAKEQKIGLLGVHFKDGNIEGSGYYNAAEGTGLVLLKAIDTICYKNNISDKASLPLLFSGHSAGGCFSYTFSEFNPERVVGYINTKGGCIGASDTKTSVPGLLIAGEYDSPEFLREIFLQLRQKNSPICFAIQVNSYHEWGTPEPLMMPFLKAALEKRIASDYLQNNQLIDISEESCLLGNLETFEFKPYNNYTGDVQKASWLISTEFAERWHDYVSSK